VGRSTKDIATHDAPSDVRPHPCTAGTHGGPTARSAAISRSSRDDADDADDADGADDADEDHSGDEDQGEDHDEV
jgi:hypothetical protein